MAYLGTTLTSALTALANAGGSALFESGSCWVGTPTEAMPRLTMPGLTRLGKCALITPRHVVFAWHTASWAGISTGRALTLNGNDYDILTTRQIAGTDIGIATMDTDIPLTPIKIVPSNWRNYLANNAAGVPVCLAENRNQKAVAWQSVGDGGYEQATDSAFASYLETVDSGDSGGLILSVLGGEFILWGTLYGDTTPNRLFFPILGDYVDAINAALALDSIYGNYSLTQADFSSFDGVLSATVAATASGMTASLAATPSGGSATKTYQWQARRGATGDFVNLPGVTGATTSATLSPGLWYVRAAVSDADGQTATSNTVALSTTGDAMTTLAKTSSHAISVTVIANSGSIDSYGGNVYLARGTTNNIYSVNTSTGTATSLGTAKKTAGVNLTGNTIYGLASIDANYWLVATVDGSTNLVFWKVAKTATSGALLVKNGGQAFATTTVSAFTGGSLAVNADGSFSILGTGQDGTYAAIVTFAMFADSNNGAVITQTAFQEITSGSGTEYPFGLATFGTGYVTGDWDGSDGTLGMAATLHFLNFAGNAMLDLSVSGSTAYYASIRQDTVDPGKLWAMTTDGSTSATLDLLTYTLTAPTITAGTPTTSTIPITGSAASDGTGAKTYSVYADSTLNGGSYDGSLGSATGLSSGASHSVFVRTTDGIGFTSDSNVVTANTETAIGGTAAEAITTALMLDIL